MSTTAPTRVARPKGLRESVLDMGRSLGLMAVVMAVVLLLTPARGLIFPDRNDRMPAVDYSDVVSGFGQITHRPAFGPVGLPSSWRANAANLSGSSAANERLHVGFVTPGSRYAGVDETAGDPVALIADLLGRRGVAVAGTATIGGVTWLVRTSDRGERSLTRIVDGVTIVVTGNARAADLDRLCASLRPAA
jgi:hypothetical protein